MLSIYLVTGILYSLIWVALKKMILCISTPAGGSGEFISNHSVLLTPLIDRQDKEHLTRCSAAMGEQPGGSECECVFSV